MFEMLTKLTKATVAVALTPIAVVADIVTLPANETDPFGKTAGLMDSVAKNVKDALK